jgi:protein SCO1/2
MAQAQQRLEAEGGFRGVMVSVDPERDEPSLLAAYVGAFSPAFVGVTGPRKQIVELARQVNVAFLKVPAQEGGYSVDHSGQIVIINPQGQYHGFIKMPHVTETIVQTFRALAAQ